MIILDEPYASVPLLDWMEASAHPVLANGFTEKLVAGGRTLNLVDADECARAPGGGGAHLHKLRERSGLDSRPRGQPTLTDAIRLFKDKAAMAREARASKPWPVP